MKSNRTGALAVAAFFLISPFARGDDFKPASGLYDALLVAVDPATGAISGYIRADWVGSGTASAPQFTCDIAFSGAGGGGKIVAWTPGSAQADGAATIGGSIGFKPDRLTLTLQRRPDGCQYLMGDDAGLDQGLSARHDWRAVRVVRSARAYFFDAPDGKTRRKAFAVRNDGVGVLRRQENWAEVEFVGGERTTRGWMKIDDFFADAAPSGSAPAAGTAAPRAALAQFLRAYAQKEQAEPDPKTRYLAADVHLKEGGDGQTLVYLIGSDWCGSGGCEMLVLDRDGQTYRLVTEVSLVRLPVRLLSSRRNGWRDIAVWVGGGGDVQGHEARLIFDGKAYPGNPSMVRAKSTPKAGSEVFSEKDEGSPLFP
jgi:hypothetical protein